MTAAARRELDAIPEAEQRSLGVTLARIELGMTDGDWSGVIRLCPDAVAAAPTEERPWVAWAYALREMQQIRQALEVLLRGELTISEPTVLVDYNLACYLALLGDLKEARRRLNRVIKREPSWREEAAKDPDLSALHPSL